MEDPPVGGNVIFHQRSHSRGWASQTPVANGSCGGLYDGRPALAQNSAMVGCLLARVTRDVWERKFGGNAIASDSGGCDHVSPGKGVVNRADRTPVAVGPQTKTRHFDNGGCEAVTNQASFTTEPLVPVGPRVALIGDRIRKVDRASGKKICLRHLTGSLTRITGCLYLSLDT